MSIEFSTLSFTTDGTGTSEVSGGDQPQNIHLGATHPVNIPMADYLAASTTND